MSIYYKYRVRCTSENAYKEWILKDTDTPPTTCPTNSAHTVDVSQTTIIDTIEDTVVTIKEEDIPTGGHYRTETVRMTALANMVTTATWVWPIPINVLALSIVTASEHTGDILNACVAKNTIIGAVTTTVAPASTWTSQNYTVGDNVLYGGKVYACYSSTVTNEVPTNTTYWRRGFMLPVSPTVIQHAELGYEINIWNGVTTNDMGRVIAKDLINYRLYMENNLTNTFSTTPLTPYVRMTVYPIRNFEFGPPATYDFGNAKIGSSYVPADILMYVEYTNNDNYDKTVIGRIEYLY